MVNYQFRMVPFSDTTSRNAVHVSGNSINSADCRPRGVCFVSIDMNRQSVTVYISYPKGRMYWIGRRDPTATSASLTLQFNDRTSSIRINRKYTVSFLSATDYGKVKMSARRVGLLTQDSPNAFHFEARY